MKKLILIFSVLTLVLSGCNGYETAVNEALGNFENDLEALKQRVERLEKQCTEINNNISALQTIVTALQENDYVTAVTPVTENGKQVGYRISFTKSSDITIYHGKDGKDGANGADGEDGKDGTNGTDGTNGADGADGHTPVIGVAKDTDEVYYWTVDGQWLLDADGNKVRATGTNGKDGADGEDGKDGTNGADGADGTNGADGKDGKDGITPKFKIENGYWYISYDNGSSWEQVGKATGEDGKDGANGTDGEDGSDAVAPDSIFKSVTEDDTYVYFTLSDDTVITVPKATATLPKSVTFVPRYKDGMATVTVDNSGAATAVLDFLISPKSVAATIATAWKNSLSMSAVQTATRAIEFVDMPISACTADSDKGIITVTASGANLPKSFFAGATNYSAALFISNAEDTVTSEFIPLYTASAEEGEDNVPEQVENITIPDAAFKSYLLSIYDINSDGELDTYEATFVENIICPNSNIADMTGLEYCVNLKNLDCSGNNLTTLNTSSNTAMTALKCNNNSLTDIDLSANTALSLLDCSNNQLSKLVLATNTKLEHLTCANLQITSLNIINNTWLTKVDCHNNAQLSTLTSFDFATSNMRLYVDNGLTIYDKTGNEQSLRVGDLVQFSQTACGIVFSATESATKFISTTESQSAWGEAGVVTGAADADNGATNMATIQSAVTDWATKCTALKWCTDLGEGWYLPAKSEVKAAYDQKTLLDTVLSDNGMTTFSAGNYWSSTEDSANVCYVDFTSGNIASATQSESYYVRAVIALQGEGGTLTPEPEVPEPEVPEVVAGPNNSISYTSSDSYELALYTEMGFGANITSTTFDAETKSGTIIFDGDVTRIPTMAFKNCLTLKTITLPGSITKIEDEAFYGCKGLTTIDIPNTVLSIGISAFFDCTALKSANLGTGVTTIDNMAFKSCSALESITIPESVTTLGYQVFMDCDGLTAFYGKFSSNDKRCLIVNGSLEYFAPAGVTEYTTPAAATSIQSHAFYDYDELTTLTISNNVTSYIGKSAFCGCSKLTNVTIGTSVTEIGIYAFYESGIKSIVIPDSVKSIGEQAFYQCKSLGTATIGNGVTTIGKSAFYNCTNMTGITIGTSVAQIDSAAFAGCSALNRVDITDLAAWCNITFSDSTSNPLDYAKNLYLNGTLVTRLIIPNTVTTIKDYCFYDADCIKSATIHDGVTSIGYRAFQNCEGLTNVSIGSGVLTIGDNAFEYCRNLGLVYCKAVNPPGGCYCAFHNNASDRKIYVPTASVDAYKAASYWKNYAGAIYGYDF